MFIDVPRVSLLLLSLEEPERDTAEWSQRFPFPDAMECRVPPFGDSREDSTGVPDPISLPAPLSTDQNWNNYSPSNVSQSLAPGPPDSES